VTGRAFGVSVTLVCVAAASQLAVIQCSEKRVQERRIPATNPGP